MRRLFVDAGNTYIKTWLLHKDELIEERSFDKEKTASDYISSVSFDESAAISTRGYWNPGDCLTIIDWETPVPLTLHYDTVHTLGMDRVVAAVGARTLYPNQSLLIVDFGSCITYDFVDHNGNFYGGGISPGIKMRFRAMNQFTGSLPEIINWQEEVFPAKSTKSSMINGVLIGVQGEIEEFIQKFYSIYGEYQIIFTGGDAYLFESKIKASIFGVSKIVLNGLKTINEFNGSN